MVSIEHTQIKKKKIDRTEWRIFFFFFLSVGISSPFFLFPESFFFSFSYEKKKENPQLDIYKGMPTMKGKSYAAADVVDIVVDVVDAYLHTNRESSTECLLVFPMKTKKTREISFFLPLRWNIRNFSDVHK